MNRNAVAVVVAGWVLHHRADRAMPTPPEMEPVSARGVLKPRLPAPRMSTQAVPLEAPAENPRPTNAFARLLNNDGNPPELSRAQVESYLGANRRSAESLLTAFRLTGDRALLQEASEKHPNDPRVNYAAWSVTHLDDASSPEAVRARLDAFKQSASDNALANYLSAQHYFQSGQTDQDLISFFDRIKVTGEMEALRWARTRIGGR